eukprot:1162141-Pelagomonas_calceolata.AAC.4
MVHSQAWAKLTVERSKALDRMDKSCMQRFHDQQIAGKDSSGGRSNRIVPVCTPTKLAMRHQAHHGSVLVRKSVSVL